jgi:1-deoxy-D-xylulose-5-phosphate reductoisomerase
MTFESFDDHGHHERFPGLKLAWRALEATSGSTTVLNAANEVAVAAFLDDRISFLGMSDLVAKALHTHSLIPQPTLEDYRASDAETRLRCENWLIAQTF